MSHQTLSKSDYMLFLKHPAWLWLKKFDKAKLPPIDANLQAMFDAGNEFEMYAEQLFPDGVSIGFDISNFDTYKTMPSRTKAILDEGASTIFQGRFEVDGLTCIVDVLERVEGNTFDLFEIKSSTKAKPEHEYDLAFQCAVLKRFGIKTRSIAVIHANSKYVREGDIAPDQLTEKTDVTDAVHALSNITEEMLEKAFGVLKKITMPDLSPRFANQLNVTRVPWMSEWMNVYKSLNADLDPYSIYFLSYPSTEQMGKLEDAGITLIKDVPKELVLRAKQGAQIQTIRDDTRIIDKKKIKEFLDTFQYPLYFFDYETLSSVIPVFDGLSPYKDYPFQYSLHILESPDGEVRHTEYLHQDDSNPMPALLANLKEGIGDTGTVLTWNMGYEKGCNARMAELYPEYNGFLENLNERIEDLMTPFSKLWFVDKDFFGSASIKNVLPILVPDLTYKTLKVSDGLYARRLWMDTFVYQKNSGQKNQILENLSEYCTLDTLAMVEIYKKLLLLK
jgi:hypothetical protein